jgi:hypothetical protein
MPPICNKYSLSRRAVLVLFFMLTSVTESARSQQTLPNESSVEAVLRSQEKWIFAYTNRRPLDPLESWNQHPATIDRDGEGFRLKVLTPYTGATSIYPLQLQAGGFSFQREGVGEYFMRLEAAAVNAPFKGEVGDRTIWLLRAK